MAEASLKPGWTKVKFGEVVRLCKDRSSDPEADGIERYVGLEHLVPEDLRVRSWGLVAEGTTFTSHFKPGQVLFGKRRAYQRKVAIADFEGVCSGDIYVFESADPKYLLPEILPFICQTEQFFDYAVGTSAGSLSPRTNWKKLKDFEFLLPALEAQKEIALLLRTIHAVIDEYRLVKKTGENLIHSVLLKHFSIEGKEMIPLEKWCDQLITYGIVQAGPNIGNGIPYIRVSDMTSNTELSIDGMLRTSSEIAKKYERSKVSSGDIVVALRGAVGLPKVIPPELEGANLTQGTARVSVRSDFSTDYVYWALQSPQITRQIKRYSKGSTFSEISLKALRTIQLPAVTESIQQEIGSQLNSYRDAIRSISARIDELNTLLIETRQKVLFERT